MHKDMKELRALKEEAAQAARQVIFDEREREVREARRLQWLESRNSQLEIRQNEPNQVQNSSQMDWNPVSVEEFLEEMGLNDPTIYLEQPLTTTKANRRQNRH
jgi:hypothetical protein